MRRFYGLSTAIMIAGVLIAAGSHISRGAKSMHAADEDRTSADRRTVAGAPSQLEKATFASGCFWCTEAVFQQLRGVESVRSGYTGGQVENPTYEQVCGGDSGHAEAIELTFDPKAISYKDLLEVFWKTHDPTTLNRQGADQGTQYRSAIFYHNDEQRRLAEHYRDELDQAKAFAQPIVTEIVAASTFYPAEKYHQNYFRDNARQPYCAAVIRPKVDKVKEVFRDRIK